MEGADNFNPEVIEILRSVAKDGSEIEELVNELNKALDSMHSPHAQQQYSSINAKYSTVLAKLDKIIRQSQLALARQEGTVEIRPFSPIQQTIPKSPSQPAQIVEHEEPKLHIHKPRHMFELFTTREMKLCDMPYPSLCGAIPANADERIPIDEFVAAKVNDDDEEYILFYVAGYEDDETYIIVDAHDENPKAVKKHRSELLPLPTTLPKQKSARVEYPAGSHVLALWPLDNDEWTSAFYPATVVKVPSKTGSCYTLRFEGDTDNEFKDVRENFVIRDPQGNK